MRLSLSDFELLQRTILELHQLRGAAAFQAALPVVLNKLIPARLLFSAGVRRTIASHEPSAIGFQNRSRGPDHTRHGPL